MECIRTFSISNFLLPFQEEVGIRAVEDLLTDFLQLCHVTVGNIISLDTGIGGGGDSDDDTHDTVHTTIHAGEAGNVRGKGIHVPWGGVTTIHSGEAGNVIR